MIKRIFFPSPIGVFLLALALTATASAQRPSAPKMLPHDTLAYIRIGNTKTMVKEFQQTSMGRMVNDEQVKPLIGALGGTITQAFNQISDRVGLTLDKILALPQGELCIALVKSETNNVDVVAIIEMKDHIADARKVIEKGEQQLINDGGSKITEKVGDVEVAVYKQLGEDRRMALFDRDGVMVFASDIELAKQLLAVWDGDKEQRTLAQNRKFLTIMRRSVGTKEETPQVSFYADPIEIVRAVTKGNLGAAAVLGTLPILGLDGFKAVGGSMIFNAKDFDSIMHFHVLLDVPPTGLLKLMTFGNEEITPEPWIPNDIASYMSVNWKPRESFEAISEVYNTFRGEGAIERDVLERGSQALGIDVKKDLIDNLSGRFTVATRIEEPIRLNSQATLVAARVTDPKKMRDTLATVLGKWPQAMEKKTYKGVTFFQGKGLQGRRPQNINPNFMREQVVILGVVGDYLVFTDSPRFFNRAVNTMKNPKDSLSSSLDYKLIAGRIMRQLGQKKPSMIAFERPEESMRMVYELVNSDQTRGFLDRMSENVPFVKGVNTALKDNPLPPFEVIAKYLAPAGGLLTSDETGIHYMAFALKRSDD